MDGRTPGPTLNLFQRNNPVICSDRSEYWWAPDILRIFTCWKVGQSCFPALLIGVIKWFSESSPSPSLDCRASFKRSSSTTHEDCVWYSLLTSLTWKWIKRIKTRQSIWKKRTGYSISFCHIASQPDPRGHVQFESDLNDHQELTSWIALVTRSCHSFSHSDIPFVAANVTLCCCSSSSVFCCRQ